MMKKLNDVKIGFFGTPEFSLRFLEELFLKKVKISFVVTQPPRISGRGKKVRLSPVHKWAIQNNLKVFIPESLDDKEFLEKIASENVDLNVIVAYGQLLSESIINSPNLLSINVHASLLPRWRGAAPIQRAILAGDKSTGVSVIRVDKKLDSGPTILEKTFKIEDDDDCGKIYEKMILHGRKLLNNAILNVINKKFKYKFQKDRCVTYAKKIDKSESKIIWNNDAYDINLKIRAFSPNPGAWTTFNNSKARIKILKAVVVKDHEYLSNRKYKIGSISENLEVKCAKNFLRIIVLQKEGKKPILASDFLNGNRIRDFSFL